MHKIYLIFFCLTFTFLGKAQNLTGTWEGKLDDEQFLQLNIMHSSKGICGYSYDSVVAKKGDYCRAYFNGFFNKKMNDFYMLGVRFLENSGDHNFMEFHFTYLKEKNKEYLIQEEDWYERLKRMAKREPFIPITLVKVFNEPSAYMKDVYEPCTEKPIATLKKDTSKTQVPIIKMINDLPTVKKADTIKINSTKKIPSIEKQVEERKNTVIQTIKIKSSSLTITLYDNGIIDGDTISVLHNGKLLVDHQLLEAKGIDIFIELSKEKPHHEIVLFAHNLGSIPPNTALLVIKAGKERYELRAEADLKKNATLVFEYEPPE